MSNSKNNTALLVMDMQVPFIGMLPNSAEITGKVARAIASARTNNIPVIYVVVGFRQAAPEISASNKGFMANKQLFANIPPTDFTAIHPDLAPLENECVVTKRRVSAFTGSDLEVLLRAFNIHHIILTGIATSGVVLSTIREAADKDYQITVLSDACADRDEEVHQVLTTKVFPRQADVLTVAEWIRTATVA